MSWTRKKIKKNKILPMVYYHLKQYGTLYVIAIFCLITALIAGATSAFKVSSASQQSITIINADYVQGLVRNVILNEMMVITLFVSGPFYLGILSAPIMIGYLGFEAGYSMMFLILNQKLKGIIFSLIGLALSNTFMFIVIIYAAVMACSFSFKKIVRKTQNVKIINQKEKKEYLIRFIFILVIVLIVSLAKVFLQRLCGCLLY